MAFLITSPGSCGEFIQGYMDGYSFMMTCPIDRYSHAMSGPGVTFDIQRPLQEKAEAARKATLKYIGCCGKDVPVQLRSYIRQGKGLASSTADISAVSQAAALACGRELSFREIASLALSIEPSDATFFRGIVQFDYRKGSVLNELGPCPDMKILIYDCGGEIDTMQFNSRQDIVALQRANEPEIRRAAALFLDGLHSQSLTKIGKAATMSALANQSILFKGQLPRFWEEGSAAGGLGVIAAHSGTVLGLILPPEADENQVRLRISRAFQMGLSWLDCVSVTNEGLTYKECDSYDFPEQ